jgi:hypothetical protein
MGHLRCPTNKPIASKRALDLSHDLAEALARLPDVEIRSIQPQPLAAGRRLDLVVLGEVKGRPVRFLIEFGASRYPREVQMAIGQLAGLRRLEGRVAEVPLRARLAGATGRRGAAPALGGLDRLRHLPELEAAAPQPTLRRPGGASPAYGPDPASRAEAAATHTLCA